MPTELEELVGFIASPNPQIRALAVENLVPFSQSEPSIFKTEESKPIKNLKILIRDHPKIAEHAITILINLSGEEDVQELLAKDDIFVNTLLLHLVHPENPCSDLLAMLLANLSKHDHLKTIIAREQEAPEELKSDKKVFNQLMDLFVRGQDGTYNKKANFDYLAYVFADLSKHETVRQYYVTEQTYDKVTPLSKLKVFTEHKSNIRRKGVASTIKNVSFEMSAHPSFLSPDELNMLPYILLPIMGSEEYDVDETMDMLPDLQLLPPDKQREPDSTIVQTHVETLTILTTSREGRDYMREIKVYPIIRETHARVDDDGVKEACERLVNVLMRDEEGEGKQEIDEKSSRVIEIKDDDDEIVEV